MPKVTIWVREGEDFAIWQQIEDIPSFIHECLQMQAEAWAGEAQNEQQER